MTHPKKVSGFLLSTKVVGGISRETFSTVVPDQSALTIVAAIEIYVEQATSKITD